MRKLASFLTLAFALCTIQHSTHLEHVAAQDAEPSAAAKLLKEGRVLKKDEFIPAGEANFALYKNPDRAWMICATSNTNPADKAYRYYEISECDAKSAKTADVACNAEGEPISEDVKITTIDFAKDTAKVRVAPTAKYDLVQFPDETIKVGAGTFACFVFSAVSYEGKEPVFANMVWMSKKYPGLAVCQEKPAVTIELAAFIRDKGDKDDANPVAQRRHLPGAPKADWSLYSKKGRKWTTKMTSKFVNTSTTYEILNVGADFCEYKVTTVDKDKKLIGQPATNKLEFTDENAAMYVKPLAAYKKVREEKLKAAGVEWDCIVYEGSLIKDQTQTIWDSKKYPGLQIKILTKTGKTETLQELVEFKD